MTIQLTRNNPSPEETEGRGAWPLVVSASSQDADPKVFMHQVSTNGKECPAFTGVCSPLDLQLPTEPVSADGLERYVFYRSAQFRLFCASPEHREEVWKTCQDEVQDLLNSLKILSSTLTTQVTIAAQ